MLLSVFMYSNLFIYSNNHENTFSDPMENENRFCSSIAAATATTTKEKKKRDLC